MRSDQFLHLISLMPKLEVLIFQGFLRFDNEESFLDALERLQHLKILKVPILWPHGAKLLSRKLTDSHSALSNLHILETVGKNHLELPKEFGVIKTPEENLITEEKVTEGTIPRLSMVTQSPGSNIRWIHTGWFDELASHSSASQFPYLRIVTLVFYSRVNESLLEIHGHKITTLVVGNLAILRQWTQHLPNLREVVLRMDVSLTFWQLDRARNEGAEGIKCSLPQVTAVGVGSNSNRHHDTLKYSFEELPSYFPNMKILRFLDTNIEIALWRSETEKIRKWTEVLKTRGFRLEREDGTGILL
jgi:hypothetical protein